MSDSETSITKIHAREVFDSRGKPTVEVEITCGNGGWGRAIVPSGASTGRYEARELRDGDAQRLAGTGVLTAVCHVNEILAPALRGCDAAAQDVLDQRLCELDGTSDKSKLGANALLGVSLAAAHAAASARRIPLVRHLHTLWQQAGGPEAAGQAGSILGTKPLLPLPMVNMISGGLHAGGNLDFQDFLIIPLGATSYRQALDWIVSIYHALGIVLEDRGYEGTLVGDEGGYGPKLWANEAAVEFILAAIEAVGLRPGEDVALGLDVASSHFFSEGKYTLSSPSTTTLEPQAMIDLLAAWVDRYPILSIEDGLAEEDWEPWGELTRRIGNRVQLIGDDLFVTNAGRLRRGIETGVANSVLVKVNQIGTLSETFETLRTALAAGYTPVISARSGETEDATIADLAVATGAGQIKIGSVARSERLAKYNQLLRLEELLGSEAPFAGKIPFAGLSSNPPPS
jgi:enolase